jgi:putative transposase
MLTAWKKQDDLVFLNEVSSVPLQQTLRHAGDGVLQLHLQAGQVPNIQKKRNGGFAEFSSSAFRCRYGKWFRGLQASHHDGVALASRAITPSSSSPQPRAAPAFGWTTA